MMIIFQLYRPGCQESRSPICDNCRQPPCPIVTTGSLVTHPRLYVPKIASLAETQIIVTLLWCSGLLRFALGYLVGLRHCDSR